MQSAQTLKCLLIPTPLPVSLTLACPCITFGANAEMVGEDWMLYCLFCLIPGATCYFGPYIRQKIRATFGIDVSYKYFSVTYVQYNFNILKPRLNSLFGISVFTIKLFQGTDNSDVLAYLLCPCLAIVQETQELKSGGMKPGGDAMNRS